MILGNFAKSSIVVIRDNILKKEAARYVMEVVLHSDSALILLDLIDNELIDKDLLRG